MLLRPELKKHPVAVARTSSQRLGIVVTSNYLARQQGVKTTMPVWKAKQHCRDLVIVPPHFDEYRAYSRRFFSLLRTYTDAVEPASIDEAYLDVSDWRGDYVALAKTIQDELLDKVGLPCSIGIAPNKFLAKMASDLKKPLGISVLRKRDWPRLFYDKPIEVIHGIGEKMGEKLRQAGYDNVQQLAEANPAKMAELFGPKSIRLIDKAQGVDDRMVDPERAEKRKSVGVSSTFDADLRTLSSCERELKKLAAKLSERLSDKQLAGFSLTVQIKYASFETTSKTTSFLSPLSSETDIVEQAAALFTLLWNKDSVRLLGLSIGKLVSDQQQSTQLNLFTFEREISQYEQRRKREEEKE